MVKVKDTESKYAKRGQCGFCLAPCKSGAKQCMKCRTNRPKEKTRIKRALEHERLLNRPCKKCGNPINSLDKRQVKCGLRCPGYREFVSCCVCGSMVQKYKGEVRDKNCCSLNCQRKHALEINRGRLKVNWDKRSLNAKLNWNKNQSRTRSLANKWSKDLCSKILRINKSNIKDVWEYRISTRLSSAKGRAVKRAKKCVASDSIERALKRIIQKRNYFEMDCLSKKIGNKLSNISHRRRRKNEIKRIKGRSNTKENNGLWVQMCFDWVGDN